MKNVIFIVTMFAVIGCYDAETDSDTEYDTDTYENSETDSYTDKTDSETESNSAVETETESETVTEEEEDAGIVSDTDTDTDQTFELPCKHNMCYCDLSDPEHKYFRCCIEGRDGWYWGLYICTGNSTCLWSGDTNDSSGCATTW